MTGPHRLRRLILRLALVGLACAGTLAACEWVLRAVGVPQELPAFLSAAEYREHLKRANRPEPPEGVPDGWRYSRHLRESREELRRFPLPPGRFAVPKAPGVFRIFTFGGSTTYGLPFTQAAGQNQDLSFPAWLRLRLGRRFPDREVEVLNVGAIGQTLEGALDWALECLDYEPDLFLFYSGHNEFLPHALLLARARAASNLVLPAASGLLRTRLGRLWQNFAVSVQESRNPRLGTLDFPVVEEWLAPGYHTPGEKRVIEEGYRRHLDLLARSCRAAGVELVVCTLACNLVDFEPSLSSSAEPVAAEVRAPWTAAVEAARGEFRSGRPAGVLRRLDPLPSAARDLAEVHYLRGRALLALGRRDEARAELSAARDADGVIRRVTSSQNEMLRRFAGEGQAHLVDVEAAFERAAGESLPGNELFYDHVHPTLEGTRILVQTLEQFLTDSGLIPGRVEPPVEVPVDEELSELGFVPAMLSAVNASQATAYGGLILLRLYDPEARLAAARGLVERIAPVPAAQYLRAQVLLACLEVLAGHAEPGRERLKVIRQVDATAADALLQGFLENSQSEAIRQIFRDAGLGQ